MEKKEKARCHGDIWKRKFYRLGQKLAEKPGRQLTCAESPAGGETTSPTSEFDQIFKIEITSVLNTCLQRRDREGTHGLASTGSRDLDTTYNRHDSEGGVQVTLPGDMSASETQHQQSKS